MSFAVSDMPLNEATSQITLSYQQNNRTNFFKNFMSKCTSFWNRDRKYHPRVIHLTMGSAYVETKDILPKNTVSNTKYTILTFLPLVLFQQFKYFFNLYFLFVAMVQLIPILRIGYIFTHIAPLVFVLLITTSKEAFDDYKRWKRDKEANSQLYARLSRNGEFESVPSSELKVGDLVKVVVNQRVPADLILFRTTELTGASFIRTDQLDGEIDWKLRRALSCTQKLSDFSLFGFTSDVYVEPPKKDIYQFVGNITVEIGGRAIVESISTENTIWANSVVASGNVTGLVVYTGTETRASMNINQPGTKIGKIDLEINRLSKFLFVLLFLLSVILEAMNSFSGNWFIYLFRFFLLFSSIIPISMRVNLDMGKVIYSYFIMKDKDIDGTVVRNSTIPEDLGRISYLMTDKTGTLTQNDMVLNKIHLGFACFTKQNMEDIKLHVNNGYKNDYISHGARGQKLSMDDVALQMVRVMSLCHNVTPKVDEELEELSYEASSPDEVALVKFTETISMVLYDRKLDSIAIENPFGIFEEYKILEIFPFTSETKRMGIILRSVKYNTILFLLKGADMVMSKIVEDNDWLEEESANFAREGLRTLVFAMKVLTEAEYSAWNEKYLEAKSSISNRKMKVQEVIALLEREMKLLGLTGVEDKLQTDVMQTLESLKNAGIKVWMLTGDKAETAKCIAISSRMISNNQEVYQLTGKSKPEIFNRLGIFSSKKDTPLIIEGESLQICLDNYRKMFVDLVCKAPSVVCCRCSPTQKADIVNLIKRELNLRVCAIGDGGNDVSMIQAADMGLGIVGKEGRQASLAADISITKFSYIKDLFLWHGRNSYKRSARLSQFVIHRGLLISFIQAVFSAIFYFAAIPIYSGWLVIGYSTFFTMAPIFSLVLDVDVKKDVAMQFPELYQELQKSRCLNTKTFMIWLSISIYQGGIIMFLSVLLFNTSLYSIVSITYTTLIFAQLLNLAFEISHWKAIMVVCELVSLAIYICSIFLLKGYFDLSIILTFEFMYKAILITAIATGPIYTIGFLRKKYYPSVYSKLS